MINKRKTSKTKKKSLKAFLNLKYLLIFFLFIVVFLLGLLFNKFTAPKAVDPQAALEQSKTAEQNNLTKLQGKVIKNNYVFKIKWGDIGKKMVADGVIDKQKLAKAVTGTDTLPQNLDKYLTDNQSSIEINQQNAQFWVDVLWGLGLANNNPILDSGPMIEGGNTANFASTGGYTLGVDQPMDIYSKHLYINLTANQQKEVEEIAGNIYRPCCGNSTAFPDCNHGMAALGLIELMVSQNFNKNNIYKAVLAFNTYWFPQTYLDIAYYFQKNGKDYSNVPAQELLSKTFSSAMGYQVVHKKVGNIQWPALQNGGSCGV